jgi:hypothetical protein
LASPPHLHAEIAAGRFSRHSNVALSKGEGGRHAQPDSTGRLRHVAWREWLRQRRPSPSVTAHMTAVTAAVAANSIVTATAAVVAAGRLALTR